MNWYRDEASGRTADILQGPGRVVQLWVEEGETAVH